MSVVRARLRSRKWPFTFTSGSSVLGKRLCSSVVPHDEPHPQYPTIRRISPLDDKLRRKQEWHDWLKSHETVEEKLFEINMPKYYGWKSLMLHEGSVPYDFLAYARFATRTHLEVGDKIEPLYSDPSLDETATSLSQSLRSQVEDVILFEQEHYRRKKDLMLVKSSKTEPVHTADLISKSTVNHINTVLLANLSDMKKHLSTAMVVPDPRLEAFWFLGGVNPSQEKLEERKYRTKIRSVSKLPPCIIDGVQPSAEKMEQLKKYDNSYKLHPSLVDGPMNQPIQYIGKPMLQLRTRYPLPSAVELQETNKEAESVPHIQYEPSVLRLDQKHRHATTIPGFWPGDPQEFGLISFHSNNSLLERPPHFGEDEHKEAIHCSAIFSSFAWLLGQACYQGFSVFHDPTYPLLTQTVLTNGRVWSFYLYQLNTTLVHTKHSTENPRCNLCWGTNPMELYQSVEGGRVVGFNEDVLKNIIKLYLLQPAKREGVEMKPYLSDKPHVADIEYEERREWLETSYKHFASNRPRYWEKPEMYAWEYIYKYKFNTMPSVPKHRWFERQEPPPDARRLDDHRPFYRPKSTRPEELRWSKFWRPFYPGTNKVPRESPTPRDYKLL